MLSRLTYDVPEQDLRYPLWRMPTHPRSGFIITNVRSPVPPGGATPGTTPSG
jgi:fatty-acid peroxygenase